MKTTEAQKRAHTKYMSKMTSKIVRFNQDTEREMIDFIEKEENFTSLVKRLIQSEMDKQKNNLV